MVKWLDDLIRKLNKPTTNYLFKINCGCGKVMINPLIPFWNCPIENCNYHLHQYTTLKIYDHLNDHANKDGF